MSRDVKLANTLLALAPDQLPLVKLADFAFAKDTTGRDSPPTSQVGTALFVAPEVMHNFNGAAYDGALADAWSVGIVLFILLFGRHPFLVRWLCGSLVVVERGLRGSEACRGTTTHQPNTNQQPTQLEKKTTTKK